jgi:hypothetical protein
MELTRAELLEEERRYEREVLGIVSLNGDTPAEPDDELGVLRVSDVKAQRIEWLWPARLPAGKLVVLDGDPGLCKSTMTLDFAARVTTGSPWPDHSGEPPIGNVVLLSAEDGIADTIRPRLEAHGADLTRVVVFDSVPAWDDEGKRIANRPPSIPGDLPALEDLMRREGALLGVVDVLSAFLSGRVDSHRDQDIRGALMPLAKVAERTGACILVVRHLNKTGGANPLYRGGGSIGIIGAARAGMMVAPDPDDDDRRILAVTKSNLARVPTALAYRVVTDEEHDCARIQWDGATAHRAADLLSIPGARDDDQDDAATVLGEVLADGPLWVKECIERMTEAGFSKDQAKRAKAKLGARSVKHGKPGDAVTGWKWELRREHEPCQGSEGRSTQNPAPFAPLDLAALPSHATEDRDR